MEISFKRCDPILVWLHPGALGVPRRRLPWPHSGLNTRTGNLQKHIMAEAQEEGGDAFVFQKKMDFHHPERVWAWSWWRVKEHPVSRDLT